MKNINETLSHAGLRDSNPISVTVGAWTVTTAQEGRWDNDRYSKRYHRAYGGVYEVTSRSITFTRPWGRGTRARTVDLKGWRGAFVEKAIVAAGLAPKKAHAPLSIRLHKAYDALLVETRHGYKFYRRTLLGAPIDWVVQSPMGMIYHAETRSAALRGVHEKIRRSKLRVDGKLIDWDACKKLGFCDSGIRACCNALGLSRHGEYTQDEIAEAVRRDPIAAYPFRAELETLAEATGYDF